MPFYLIGACGFSTAPAGHRKSANCLFYLSPSPYIEMVWNGFLLVVAAHLPPCAVPRYIAASLRCQQQMLLLFSSGLEDILVTLAWLYMTLTAQCGANFDVSRGMSFLVNIVASHSNRKESIFLLQNQLHSTLTIRHSSYRHHTRPLLLYIEHRTLTQWTTDLPPPNPSSIPVPMGRFPSGPFRVLLRLAVPLHPTQACSASGWCMTQVPAI